MRRTALLVLVAALPAAPALAQSSLSDEALVGQIERALEGSGATSGAPAQSEPSAPIRGSDVITPPSGTITSRPLGTIDNAAASRSSSTDRLPPEYTGDWRIEGGRCDQPGDVRSITASSIESGGTACSIASVSDRVTSVSATGTCPPASAVEVEQTRSFDLRLSGRDGLSITDEGQSERLLRCGAAPSGGGGGLAAPAPQPQGPTLAREWADDYPGSYAVGGACETSGFVVSISPETVRVAETVCDVADLSRSGSGIVASLGQCVADGLGADDRTRFFEMRDGTLIYEDGYGSWALSRC
ncbi:hypothetical protein RM543_07645 [Roseicyclus sp. F158]|uniref:Secreted protein n=1 Tax=Tropicimonas omnivorans TaxID=3075590 RepID=A0ABU3DFQ3_9RHOB|nr:hypothetical protein [Roseicyclus sp. F158]MDT0682553.1 hypothetical protein [Roseicyclus sp. F158]